MRGRLKHKWGPLPAAYLDAQRQPEPAVEPVQEGKDGHATEPPAKRRRRSRWADRAAEEAAGDADKQIVLFPSEVVLSNGVKVVLPPAVTGRAPGGDPEVLELHRKVGTRLPFRAKTSVPMSRFRDWFASEGGGKGRRQIPVPFGAESHAATALLTKARCVHQGTMLHGSALSAAE